MVKVTLQIAGWILVGAFVICAVYSARGATWIYDPETDPVVVACIDACANQCGLVEGSPRPLDAAAIACQRRRLAGDPATCP